MGALCCVECRLFCSRSAIVFLSPLFRFQREITWEALLDIMRHGGFIRFRKNRWERVPLEDQRQKVAHAIQYRIRMLKDVQEAQMRTQVKLADQANSKGKGNRVMQVPPESATRSPVGGGRPSPIIPTDTPGNYPDHGQQRQRGHNPRIPRHHIFEAHPAGNTLHQREHRNSRHVMYPPPHPTSPRHAHFMGGAGHRKRRQSMIREISPDYMCSPQPNTSVERRPETHQYTEGSYRRQQFAGDVPRQQYSPWGSARHSPRMVHNQPVGKSNYYSHESDKKRIRRAIGTDHYTNGDTETNATTREDYRTTTTPMSRKHIYGLPEAIAFPDCELVPPAEFMAVHATTRAESPTNDGITVKHAPSDAAADQCEADENEATEDNDMTESEFAPIIPFRVISSSHDLSKHCRLDAWRYRNW